MSELERKTESDLSRDLGRAWTTFHRSTQSLDVYVNLGTRKFVGAIDGVVETRDRFANAKSELDAHGEPTMKLVVDAQVAEAVRQEYSNRPGYDVKPRAVDSADLHLTSVDLDTIDDALHGYHEIVSTFPSLLVETALVSLVATFEAFSSDCCRIVLVDRTEMLRSRKRQLPYDTILELESRADLLTEMADREIRETAYASITNQFRYFNDRFDVDVAASLHVNIDEICEITARRNILVHNSGVVNRTYLSQVGNSDLRDGDRVEVDRQYWRSARGQLEAAGHALYQGLLSRFAPEHQEEPRS